MGVPAFYRWLSQKYPLIVEDVIEEAEREVDGVRLPVDFSRPNPNGLEFDNLYLDMNGIIHPCFHPEDAPSPTTLDEIFKNIFTYIDRLFGMVRPRKLMYMAIDGVAPRAKMNQQRSRRFRAAQDAAEAEAEEERLRKEFEAQGHIVPPKVKKEAPDSNVITPGTEFMHKLSVALQYYVHLRLNNDPGWKDVKVILSDASVPGEGEHKIMNYIRLQRNLPGSDPNTRHCIYGLDADLIMLSLATHEVHFSILREVVFLPNAKDKCFLCGREGHLAAECDGQTKRKRGEEEVKLEVAKKPFQFLHIWTLREYLEFELRIPDAPFELDIERLLDDWVFICFFVGNDFLPHMPTLEIREGAIDLLITIYKQEFARLGGYLTEDGEVNLGRTEKFIQAVGAHEDAIFQKRARLLSRQIDRSRQQKKQQMQRQRQNGSPASKAPPVAPPADGYIPVKRFEGSRLASAPQPAPQSVAGQSNGAQSEGPKSNVDAAKALKEKLLGKKPAAPPPAKLLRVDEEDSSIASAVPTKVDEKVIDEDLDVAEEIKMKLKTRITELADNLDTMDDDKIRLGEEGWKERYYSEKFNAKTEEEREETRRDVVLRYCEGLVWVMRYYYQGVCSWTWYYPYHYAPFASDLKELEELEITFFMGKPFKPFDQLMGVFPAASSHALPKAYRPLMSNPNSPIIDFYPKDFKVDMNGKRFAWQGVALLPFIEEDRLLEAIGTVEHTLTDEERRRNTTLSEFLFLHSGHSLAPYVYSFYDRYGHLPVGSKERALASEAINPGVSPHMSGSMFLCDGEACPVVFPSPIKDMGNVNNNQVLSFIYANPPYHRHISRPPPGTVIPEKKVREEDVQPPKPLWHQDRGGGRGRGGQGSDQRAPVQNGMSGHQLAAGAHRMVLSSIGRGNPEALAYLQQRQQQAGGQQLAHQFGSMNFPRPQAPGGGGILGIPSPYQQMQPQYNQPGLGFNQPRGPGFANQGFAAAGRGQAQGGYQQAPYVPTPVILPRPNFQAPQARPNSFQGQQAQPLYPGQQPRPNYQGQVPVPQPYSSAQVGQGGGYQQGFGGGNPPGFGGVNTYPQAQQQSWGRGGGGVAAVVGAQQQPPRGRGGPAGLRPPPQQAANPYAALDRRQGQGPQQGQGRRY